MRLASTVAYVAFAITLVLSATLVQSVLAINNYTTVLKTGDSGMYSLFGSYAHGTVNGQLKILTVADSGNGAKVTANFTGFPPGYWNGGGIVWDNIFTGESSNATSGLYFAVAAGLKQGDPIFQGSSITVQGVQSNPCGGAYRQLIGTQFWRSGELVNIAWDQNTGIMCNYGSNDQHSGILGFTLDNTTLWSAAAPAQDAFVTAFEISTFLGAPLVLLIVFVYVRRRRRRPLKR